MEGRVDDSVCKEIPNLLSSFVQTFVDFSVSGFFLLPEQNPNQNPVLENFPVGDHPHSEPLRSLPPLRTRFPAPDRLIAIGDVHGDFEKTQQSFRMAGLVDGSDRWIGGSAMVVQIGDVLDRGGQELKILYFLEKLKREAAKCGGLVISMNGNHEIMNIERDFRFVTRKGLEEFKVWADWYCVGNKMKELCKGLGKQKDPFDGVPLSFPGFKEEFVDGFRARITALKPSGPISVRFLSKNLTVLVVGDSVFVHGGLLPSHVSYGLERINEEVREWIIGSKGGAAPDHCRGKYAVVWLRSFSHESAKNCDCSTLEHVLATIPGAKRLIMGHTIQELGINGACDDKAIRIDVGMSKGCINGLPEVLEISGKSQVKILTSNPSYFKSSTHAEKRQGLGLLLPENVPKQVEVKA